MSEGFSSSTNTIEEANYDALVPPVSERWADNIEPEPGDAARNDAAGELLDSITADGSQSGEIGEQPLDQDTDNPETAKQETEESPAQTRTRLLARVTGWISNKSGQLSESINNKRTVGEVAADVKNSAGEKINNAKELTAAEMRRATQVAISIGEELAYVAGTPARYAAEAMNNFGENVQEARQFFKDNRELAKARKAERAKHKADLKELDQARKDERAKHDAEFQAKIAALAENKGSNSAESGTAGFAEQLAEALSTDVADKVAARVEAMILSMQNRSEDSASSSDELAPNVEAEEQVKQKIFALGQLVKVRRTIGEVDAGWMVSEFDNNSE